MPGFHAFCRVFALAGLIALAVSGCGRSVRPMDIASDAGTQALAQLDANKDGVLDYEELAKAPGLRAAVPTIKKLVQDKPRGYKPTESELRSVTITAEDIDARIAEWKARGTARINVTCHVTHGGMPVANAEVKFVPESFLGTGVKTGTGTTDARGFASISQPDEGGTARGMSPGFYRVEITKGVEIPPRYNTETVLGQEVAKDALGIGSPLPFPLEY
jgi:hypothetical protein